MMQTKQTGQYNYLDTLFPIYLAANLVRFADNSIEQAAEIVKELHIHRNCFSTLSMERIFLAFDFIKDCPDLRQVPDDYLRSGEAKESECRLQEIKLPFKFKL